MKKKRNVAVCLVVLCALLFVSCGKEQSQTSDEGEVRSEGVDTVCEVSYSDYSGSRKSMFLSEGDTIAVISPSSLASQEQVDTVVEGLKNWGYIPVVGTVACKEGRTTEESLNDVRWALEDPEIKAIFCVRGGYGASKLMDQVEEEMISSSEKLIIGYSDITILHSAWTKAGLPSVQGPMNNAFTDMPELCVEAEQNVLRGKIPVYQCESSSLCREGEAEGILIGGNLSSFTAVLGTDYDSTETNQPYILFLEEIGENMRHLDRYLTILRNQGVLENAAGIVFGEWTGMTYPDDFENNACGTVYESVADMITTEFLEDLDIPVAFGFPAGHGDIQYPLLMGEKVHLKVTDENYTLEWK